MSLNLTLHTADGREIRLRQTPTFITQMCLSIDPATGEPAGGMSGVRQRYLYWLDSTLNGVWESSEDYEFAREDVLAHKLEVLSITKPEFSFT